jgi:hypothetical protein
MDADELLCSRPTPRVAPKNRARANGRLGVSAPTLKKSRISLEGASVASLDWRD